MSRNRTRILKMLANGKIAVDEAERLLDAIGHSGAAAPGDEPGASGDGKEKPKPRFLRVQVEESDGDRVNVRVPLNLIRAGVKLGSLVPGPAMDKVNQALHEKGIRIDLGGLKSEALEELIAQLSELSVDVDEQGGDKVRVFCE